MMLGRSVAVARPQAVRRSAAMAEARGKERRTVERMRGFMMVRGQGSEKTIAD
jgi:hypothetical protein